MWREPAKKRVGSIYMYKLNGTEAQNQSQALFRASLACCKNKAPSCLTNLSNTAEDLTALSHGQSSHSQVSMSHLKL